MCVSPKIGFYIKSSLKLREVRQDWGLDEWRLILRYSLYNHYIQ